MNLLDGYKTYIAAIGLFGLSLYQLSQGDFSAAAQTFLAGLAALGIRHAITRSSVAGCVILLASASSSHAQEIRKPVLDHVRDVSVSIESEDGEIWGSGTIFLKDGEAHVVTARHVVDGAETIRVVQHNGGQTVAVYATLTCTVPDVDVAILRVGKGVFTRGARLHEAQRPAVDSVIVSCGNLQDLTHSINRGWLVAHDRDIGLETPRDQGDMTCYPGCSGGGVFSKDGSFIGVMTNGGVRVTLFVPIRALRDSLQTLHHRELQ